MLLAVVASLVFHDRQYGPQAALIAERFGTNVRYSGAGLGYEPASVIRALTTTLAFHGLAARGLRPPHPCRPPDR